MSSRRASDQKTSIKKENQPRTLRVAGKNKKSSNQITGRKLSKNSRKKKEPKPNVLSYAAHRFPKGNRSLLNELFQAVVVINLRKRPEKLNLLDFRLQQKKVNYYLVPAVDGSTEPTSTEYRNLKKKYGNRPFFTINSAGAYGLIKTYERLLDWLVTHKFQSVLILEDDVQFHQNFDQLLQQAAKKNYFKFRHHDLIWLGANQPRWDKDQLKIVTDWDQQQQKKEGGVSITSYPISRRVHTYGAFALGLNRKAIQTLHSYYRESGPRRHSIDYQIYHLIEKDNHSFQGLVCYPNLVVADVTTSDNKQNRTQNEYARLCRWSMTDYQYLTVSQYQSWWQACCNYLQDQGLSARQIFFYYPDRISMDQVVSELNLKQTDQPPPTWWSAICKWFLDPNGSGYLEKKTLYRFLEGVHQSLVFIVPSYNNEQICEQNLTSIMDQQYPHVRIIYINDASTDKTLTKVKALIDKRNWWQRVHLIDQRINQKQGAARWLAFHLCDDDEICCLVDGDDWCYSKQVAQIIDRNYLDYSLLVSYGSYHEYYKDKQKSTQRGVFTFPPKVIQNKGYRTHRWTSQHLRTVKAGLFKRIPVVDLLDHHERGQFLKMSTDVAEMMPVLEMAGTAHRNLKESLYVYNRSNSVLYTSSYYRLKEKGNQKNLEYHKKIRHQLVSQKPYPTVLAKNLCRPKTSLSIQVLLLDEGTDQELSETGQSVFSVPSDCFDQWSQSSVWQEHHLWTGLQITVANRRQVLEKTSSSGPKNNLLNWWLVITRKQCQQLSAEQLEYMVRYLAITQAQGFLLGDMTGATSTIQVTQSTEPVQILGCLTRVTANKKLAFASWAGLWASSTGPPDFLVTADGEWKSSAGFCQTKQKLILFSPNLLAYQS